MPMRSRVIHYKQGKPVSGPEYMNDPGRAAQIRREKQAHEIKLQRLRNDPRYAAIAQQEAQDIYDRGMAERGQTIQAQDAMARRRYEQARLGLEGRKLDILENQPATSDIRLTKESGIDPKTNMPFERQVPIRVGPDDYTKLPETQPQMQFENEEQHKAYLQGLAPDGRAALRKKILGSMR